MLGHMLLYIRKKKKMTKAEIARNSNIDTGHLTHIEKCERNPSNRVLKNICSSMEIPYRPLMYTLDRKITEEQEEYEFEQYIPYNKILAVDTLDNFIDCPLETPGACIAVKMMDTSMEPKILKGSYTFIEFNVPLSNKDIGLFSCNNQLIIRRFIIRKDGLVLRAEDRNKDPDILFDENNKISMVGKVVGYQDENKQTILL